METGTHVRAVVTDADGRPWEARAPGTDASARMPVTAGHASFVVLDVTRHASTTEAHQVEGHVACQVKVLGVSVPGAARFHDGGNACAEGAPVLLAVADAPAPDPAALEPTGWSRVVSTPDTNRPVRVTEYAYPVADASADGWDDAPRVAYAWGTQVLDARVNPHTGNAFNFVSTVNPAHLDDGSAVTVWTLDQLG